MERGFRSVVLRVTAHPAWPRVRFAFLGFHALAMVLVALPAPTRGTDGTHFRSKTVQMEVAAWAARLEAIGVHRSPKALKEDLIHLSRTWVGARRTLLTPAVRYQRAINARQGWYMFTGPDREPARFVLDARTTSGVEVPIFEFNRKVSAPELVAPGFLESYRIRRLMLFTVWSGRKETFEEVCRAFDRHVRGKRSDLDEVRCRLLARRSAHPGLPEVERPEKSVRELVLRAQSDRGKAKRPKAKRPKAPKGGESP